MKHRSYIEQGGFTSILISILIHTTFCATKGRPTPPHFPACEGFSFIYLSPFCQPSMRSVIKSRFLFCDRGRKSLFCHYFGRERAHENFKNISKCCSERVSPYFRCGFLQCDQITSTSINSQNERWAPHMKPFVQTRNRNGQKRRIEVVRNKQTCFIPN